jgi:hypothetical protein
VEALSVPDRLYFNDMIELNKNNFVFETDSESRNYIARITALRAVLSSLLESWIATIGENEE